MLCCGMCSMPQMLGCRGRQDMGNVVMRAYWRSKQLFVALFIFHFREKYLDEQTSTRLYFQSKDALPWWGLFSCVCFSCWSAVSFCCEEQWLTGRYYHPYKKSYHSTLMSALRTVFIMHHGFYTVLPCNLLRKTHDHKGKCQKYMLLYV